MLFIERIRKLGRLLWNDVKWLSGRYVLINSCLCFRRDGSIIHSNWGDDINWFFLREISKRPILSMQETLFAKRFATNYLCIGSTLALTANNRSVVWGSGILSAELPEGLQPKEVCAVRGPLTRQVLLERGIECPEVYGDPALLLPLHYRPAVAKRHRLGIVVHYADQDAIDAIPTVDDIHYIKIKDYADWHDFIDEICSCEAIISSSLHGLIISEAYGIPSQWIEFPGREGMRKDRFKYYDFYGSIGKTAEPMIVDSSVTADQIFESLHRWQPGTITLAPLIAACPFPLKPFI